MRRLTTILATASVMAALTAAGLSTAAPAQAAGCTPMDGGSTYLSPWGDYNTYALAPGGSFDSYNTPWQMQNAAISTYDDSPWDVTGTRYVGSMAIGYGGKATSTSMCVKWQDDRLRFFYKAAYGTSFKVSTQVSSDYGTYTYSTWVTSYSSGWQLSPTISIPDWTDASGTELLKVSVSNPYGSTMKIDDVLVDPWKFTTW